MKFLMLTAFVFLYSACFGQGFINYKKAKVKEKVAGFYSKKNIQTIITETDSSVTFLLNDTAYSSLTIIYYFNKQGRCYKETQLGNCEQCFKKLFADSASIKRYNYKRINDNQYVSKPFWNLTVIVHETQPYSFSIISGYYKRKLQKQLYKNS